VIRDDLGGGAVLDRKSDLENSLTTNNCDTVSDSPHYIAPARTAQNISLPLLRYLSLPGKQHMHRAVP
jgi:hypothetical protein